MRSPPLKALYAFEAFARRGSMTAAADELCVTHGAVSRQVRQLELQLGAILVQGPKNRLRLTEAGLELADHLTTAFRAIEAAVAQPVADAESSLHISCLRALAMKWLIPRLADFHAVYPKISVRISESYLPCDFRRDGVDLAIRVAASVEQDGVEVTALMDQFYGPVVAPNLIQPEQDVLTLLATLPRLHSQSYLVSWTEWQADAGVTLDEPETTRTFEHNAYTIEAVAAGLGAAICPFAFVADDLAKGRLAAPLGFVPTHTFYAALRPAGIRNRASAAFRDWLAEQARMTPGPSSTHALG